MIILRRYKRYIVEKNYIHNFNFDRRRYRNFLYINCINYGYHVNMNSIGTNYFSMITPNFILYLHAYSNGLLYSMTIDNKKKRLLDIADWTFHQGHGYKITVNTGKKQLHYVNNAHHGNIADTSITLEYIGRIYITNK